jgi:hypothetical protein
MFTGQKYVTNGVQQQIPAFLQNILWYLVETMLEENKDCMQVFTLEPVTVDDKQKLRILHTQELPNYRQEFTICTKSIVTSQIYVIDENNHCIMLLASEY